METKPRILYLLKILTHRTDEDHPLTTRQLIDILQNEYGISAYRTTISKDMIALKEFGIDIVTIHSTQCKYYIGKRRFDLSDLKMLIDAVETSKLITKENCDMLLEKLYSLASTGKLASLRRSNYLVDGMKLENPEVSSVVNTINDAINSGKKIAFQYFEYSGLKQKVLKDKGEIYKISPYHLVWSSEHCHVVGYSEKQHRMVIFRADQIMPDIKIMSSDSLPIPEDFDLAEFTRSEFVMFNGDIATVVLRCDNSLMKTMIDRFGENVTTLAYDMTSFRLITEVAAGPAFLGWVFGFGGKVQILAPGEVKERYRQMIARANEDVKLFE